jgi:hypothetical protein
MLCHVGYGGVPCLIITPRQTGVGRVHRCSSTLKPFGALLNWAREHRSRTGRGLFQPTISPHIHCGARQRCLDVVSGYVISADANIRAEMKVARCQHRKFLGP